MFLKTDQQLTSTNPFAKAEDASHLEYSHMEHSQMEDSHMEYSHMEEVLGIVKMSKWHNWANHPPPGGDNITSGVSCDAKKVSHKPNKTQCDFGCISWNKVFILLTWAEK